ncbi:MAG: hypothetical protein FWC38_00480 [Proteobacteria bacterium]|nr:hypothetical protein [Pseudomonadota bacterium]MCL2306718.1 hypothetical protein [Pseudomonadota bacterium]
MISFKCTKKESEIIEKIVERFFKEDLHLEKHGYAGLSKQDVEMYCAATHANGCRLNFEKLLSAPDFDFFHDIFGMIRYLDKKTGKLTQCFLPRCAK